MITSSANISGVWIRATIRVSERANLPPMVFSKNLEQENNLRIGTKKIEI